MILEGFEIENFSCIKHLVVENLPPTGVIVLHGPNGTGKSSILEALRACLMDNKSTSKALARGFPKNSSDKPRVTVTFRAGGTTWKIMKQFNSKESTLKSRTAAGEWKLETADPTEAHERTRQLAGGSDSTLGLAQLLWLTQAEFHLPEPKKFDADVQSRLRAILGVLQTPLDDRFLGCVKQEWSRWFAARSKPGEKPKLKKDCPLAKALATLEKYRGDLAAIESEFQTVEKWLENASDLEIRASDLRRQLAEATRSRDLLQKEYEQSLKSLELHRLAAERVAAAQKELANAAMLRERRKETERRLATAQESAAETCQAAKEWAGKLASAEQSLRSLRSEIQTLRQAGHELQSQRDAISKRLNRLSLREQASAAREKLVQAEQVQGELEELQQQALAHPVPDATFLNKFAANHKQADDLRADLKAAAIALTLNPNAGAAAPLLAVDGATPCAAPQPTNDAPIEVSIRRRAEIAIPGWGHIVVTRGGDRRSLDQIESDLTRLEQAFAQDLAPFGIAASHPAPLDRLRELATEQKVREPEIQRRKKALAQIAPQGLEPLRQHAALVENLRVASESAAEERANLQLSTTAAELGRLADDLKERLDTNQNNIDVLDVLIGELEAQIEGIAPKAKSARKVAPGLRQQEADAKEASTALSTTALSIRAELDRLLTGEQIECEIGAAGAKLASACAALDSAKLSQSEETVSDRLESAKEGARTLDSLLKQVERDFNLISGQLRSTAGLHQKRAAAAARFEELDLQTRREQLESEAYDRLYALFEECREKQLGAVMGPVHDRVLRWMKLLRIGGYQSIHFNDQFLPETLLARDGAMELTVGEESVGTIEQLALMVRLALGATLSTPENPVAAMLDDPLTHSDVVRLDRMRAVLRSAAAGDPAAVPAAGPLQIVVFTCHPEWFVIEGATAIDLGEPEVLTRLAL